MLASILWGLAGSVPLSLFWVRLYHRHKRNALTETLDGLVMPMSKHEWLDYERKFYEFRELIYGDSRDFLSGP